ncbi:hypothetical protein GWK36_12105 [Caldichromatium japonicum]|uniref:Glycosyltransferase RgtA/B/C/D-like domain-containing protein n=1 Tax=Caldichromatium japonicum TaxID=2699430 RepID=A0A6G7VFC6_9GAMM|nr:hypothetical protein [Caldichromatium japonicum]QIK38600.1 hypothetical protein GWK36_12105 [Caldichromatium japonicum]
MTVRKPETLSISRLPKVKLIISVIISIIFITVITGAFTRFFLTYLFIATSLIAISFKFNAWDKINKTWATQTIGVNIAFLFLLLTITFALYHPILQSWWIEDDPSILRHIMEYPIIDNFIDSNTWRTYMPNNLTPFLIFSLAIDFKLFNLEPSGYYVHHLLTLCAIILICYFLLIRYFSAMIATITLAIFITSLPIATIIQQLMTRHYLDGLLFSAIMFLFYSKAFEEKKLILVLPSLFFYALACASKEIYVPIMVLLPWSTKNGGPKRHLSLMIPFFGVAGLYTLWRTHMLKPANILSGYGNLYDSNPSSIEYFAIKTAEALGIKSPLHLLLITASFLVCLVYIYKNKAGFYRFAGLLISGAVIMAPLVAVSSILLPRMMILAAAFVALIGAISLHAIRQEGRITRIIVLVIGLSWIGLNIQSVANSKTWGDRDWIERYHQEGQFMLTADTDQTLVYPIGPYWFYTGLAWIREHQSIHRKAPRICYDPCLCKLELKDKTLMYHEGILKPFKQDTHNCQLRDTPLSFSIVYDPKKGTITWDLGPYPEGRWGFLLEPGAAKIFVPRSGHFPMYRKNPLHFRVLYESPEGWQTPSQCLVIDPTNLDNSGVAKINHSPVLQDSPEKFKPTSFDGCQ